jgi:hypothetical protein
MVHSVHNLCCLLFIILLIGKWVGGVDCISELGEGHIGVVVVCVIELD